MAFRRWAGTPDGLKIAPNSIFLFVSLLDLLRDTLLVSLLGEADGTCSWTVLQPSPHLWWTWHTACLWRVGCESIYSEKYRPVLFLCRATTIRQLLTVLVWFKNLYYLPKVLLGTLVTRECCCAVPLLLAELERIHVQDRVWPGRKPSGQPRYPSGMCTLWCLLGM